MKRVLTTALLVLALAAPAGAVQVKATEPLFAVATRPAGTAGGVQLGVPETSTEFAELHVSLLAVTT